MKKVLIFGSGSIGNHMAFACRKIGLEVYITDASKKALKRMKDKIYPSRYGFWDNKIKQINLNDCDKLKEKFDLIIIGTPPHTHLKVYNYCKKKIKYKRILIEKPIANFREKNLIRFKKNSESDLVFCGYNHSISPSINFFINKILKNKQINKIEVNWRESWNGILNAHFWLKNQFDSYLGDYSKGGGSLQEHSHGLHLLLLILKKKKIDLNKIKVNSSSIFNTFGGKKYDIFTNIFGYYKKIYFSYNTDLFTFPAEKKVLVTCSNKKYEWICNFKNGEDKIKIFMDNKIIYSKKFKKTRSSEFENEIKHIIRIAKYRECRRIGF